MTPIQKILTENTIWSKDYVPSPNSNIVSMGVLTFGGLKLDVCVLKDGRRVFTKDSIELMFTKLGMSNMAEFTKTHDHNLYQKLINPINAIK